MPKLHLTDLSVRTLRFGERTVTYWDDTSPLGIRVGKNRKTWTIMRGDGRESITVGHYPDLSLSDARLQAKRLMVEPTAPKPIKMTFGVARDRYVDENFLDAKPRTKAEAKRLLEKHFGSLAQTGLAEVTDNALLGLLKPLPRGEALHAFRAARAFLRWCTRPPRRFISHSPLEGCEPPSKDGRRTRVLTDDELVVVWNSCSGQFGAIIRLIALWGTRKGETRAIRRDWLEGDLLTIPGSHTKNGRAHSIPILPRARAILDSLPKRGPYFFPGRWDENKPIDDGSWGKLQRGLLATSATAGWSAHDLRRTFRSNMAKMRVSRHVAEVLLNHVSGTRSVLDEIYDRYDYLDEKQESLAKWEARLAELGCE